MLSIRLDSIKLFLLLSIHHTGSRFARRDSVRIESRCNLGIELNRNVRLRKKLIVHAFCVCIGCLSLTCTVHDICTFLIFGH